MDFHTFSAALTITIYRLSPGGQRDSHQGREDWLLIKKTAENLNQVAESLECHVASQAATLLEHLHTIRHGTYTKLQKYKATVPYFGEVLISGAKNELLTMDATESEQQSNSPIFFGNVEFNANYFDYNYAGGFLDGAELGVDWTSPFEIEASFDWNHIYDSSWMQ